MAPIVLVHSPLVGPSAWDGVASRMRERGEDVTVADLTPALRDGAHHWDALAAAVARAAAGRDVVLVGHSGAGPVLAVTGSVMGNVRGYGFVDARLPHDGRSWLNTAPSHLVQQLQALSVDGWLPPWSTWWGPEALTTLVPDPATRESFERDCPRLPLSLFEEPQPPAPRWPDAPCGYLHFSEGYRSTADQARAMGWPVVEAPAQHLAMLATPQLVAESLLRLIHRMGV